MATNKPYEYYFTPTEPEYKVRKEPLYSTQRNNVNFELLPKAPDVIKYEREAIADVFDLIEDLKESHEIRFRDGKRTRNGFIKKIKKKMDKISYSKNDVSFYRLLDFFDLNRGSEKKLKIDVDKSQVLLHLHRLLDGLKGSIETDAHKDEQANFEKNEKFDELFRDLKNMKRVYEFETDDE
jgi:hypothetical protein